MAAETAPDWESINLLLFDDEGAGRAAVISLVNDVTERRAAGIDTEEDSVSLLSALDVFGPGSPEGRVITTAYPAEADQWHEEKENGDR